MGARTYRGINVFVLLSAFLFFSSLQHSLWRLKEACSRNSERTICSKCLTVVRCPMWFPWMKKNLDQHETLDEKLQFFCILKKEKQKVEIWFYKHSFTKIHFFCYRHWAHYPLPFSSFSFIIFRYQKTISCHFPVSEAKQTSDSMTFLMQMLACCCSAFMVFTHVIPCYYMCDSKLMSL